MSRAHSPAFLSLHLRHNSFSNPSVTLPTSQLVLQRFHHSSTSELIFPTILSLYLCHNSFSNPSVSSQLTLEPFFRFSYVTGSSLMSPSDPSVPPNKICTSYNPICCEVDVRRQLFYSGLWCVADLKIFLVPSVIFRNINLVGPVINPGSCERDCLGGNGNIPAWCLERADPDRCDDANVDFTKCRSAPTLPRNKHSPLMRSLS